MSPEMIQNGSHNHTLDVWCLGILLYELLHGHAPFRGQNYNTISERIMRGKIRFKKGLPEDTRNLILSLLQREANDRLPLIKVFSHPWVKRMEKKHNLSKNAKSKKSRESRKKSHQKKDKSMPSHSPKINKNVEEEEKVIDMGYGDKGNYNDEDSSARNYSYKHKKYEEEKVASNNNDASAVALEEELKFIEDMEAKKRQILNDHSKTDSKYDYLLKKDAKESFKVRDVEDHNLLHLSKFENDKKDGGMNPNHLKDLNILGENPVAPEERRSSLPEPEEFGDTIDKKPENNHEDLINFNNEKEDPALPHFAGAKPKDYNKDMQSPEAMGEEENGPDDEDKILDTFKNNISNTSFLLGRTSFDDKYTESKKQKDEIMKLISGMDDQLNSLEISTSQHTIKKNKSAFLAKYDVDDGFIEPNKDFKAGENIMQAIDNYDELKDKAEAILQAENDIDEDGYQSPKRDENENMLFKLDEYSDEKDPAAEPVLEVPKPEQNNKFEGHNIDDDSDSSELQTISDNNDYYGKINDNKDIEASAFEKKRLQKQDTDNDPFSPDRKYQNLDEDIGKKEKSNKGNGLKFLESLDEPENDKYLHQEMADDKEEQVPNFLNPEAKKPKDGNETTFGRKKPQQNSPNSKNLEQDENEKQRKKKNTIQFLKDNSSEDEDSDEIEGNSDHEKPQPRENENISSGSKNRTGSFKKKEISPYRNPETEINFLKNSDNESEEDEFSSKSKPKGRERNVFNDPYLQANKNNPIERQGSNLSTSSRGSSRNSLFMDEKQKKQRNNLQKFSKGNLNEAKQEDPYDFSNNWNKNESEELKYGAIDFGNSSKKRVNKYTTPGQGDENEDDHIEQLKEEMKEIVQNIDDDADFKNLQLMEIIKKNAEIRMKQEGKNFGNEERLRYDIPDNLWRDTLALQNNEENVFNEERNAFMSNFEKFLDSLDIDSEPTKIQTKVDGYIEQVKVYNQHRNGKLSQLDKMETKRDSYEQEQERENKRPKLSKSKNNILR